MSIEATSFDSIQAFDSASALILDAYGNPETPPDVKQRIAALLGNLAMSLGPVIENNSVQPLEVFESAEEDTDNTDDNTDDDEDDIFEAAADDLRPIVQSKQWLANKTRPYKLLSRAEEIDHCKAIEAGVLAREKLDTMPAASSGQADEQLRQDLAELEQLGRRSFDAMVYSNTGLVMKVAAKWLGSNVPFEDLVQYGMLGNNVKGNPTGGLIIAVRQYDYRLGHKFSTYAFKAIESSIRMTIDNNEAMVRIPTTTKLLMHDHARNLSRLRIELGREPTEIEMFEASGLNRDQFQRVLNARREHGNPQISLNQPFGGTEDMTLLGILGNDRIPATSSEHPDQVLDSVTDLESPLLQQARAILSDEEWELFIMKTEYPDITTKEMSARIGRDHRSVQNKLDWARQKLKRIFPNAFNN